MPPCFSVVNLREIGGRNEAREGKNFSKRAAARRHLDEDSFVRLPPVILETHPLRKKYHYSETPSLDLI